MFFFFFFVDSELNRSKFLPQNSSLEASIRPVLFIYPVAACKFDGRRRRKGKHRWNFFPLSLSLFPFRINSRPNEWRTNRREGGRIWIFQTRDRSPSLNNGCLHPTPWIKELFPLLYHIEYIYKGCPEINARFEFAAIFAPSRWQAWKKNSLTELRVWGRWKWSVTRYDNVEWMDY